MKKELDSYMSFIHKSRYARWLPSEGRRETWEETVDRYLGAMFNQAEKYGWLPTAEEAAEIRTSILSLEVMPSMRAMMTAGKALERDNVAGFNCSYLPVDHPRAFDEMMYILMCGTGVGFSVERQYVSKLPEVAEELHETDTTLVVSDSKIGWSSAFRELLSLLYSGKVPKWDVSRVRPAGARLKTMGGRSSGPDPLVELFTFTVNLFRQAAGRRLSSLECHDLCCKIASVIVVGGVRRSALISLSNLTDDRVRRAKSGQWWVDEPQRALANNSVAYTEKPDFEAFLNEWKSLYESKSGERGMFSRPAAKNQAAKNGRRDPDHDFGTNPCCFAGDMRLLTTSGYKPFSELAQHKNVMLVNNDGSKTPGRVWSSGERETVFVNWQHALGRDPIQCTPDHRFMLTDGSECIAADLKGKQPMPYIREAKQVIVYEDFLAGYMLGDANLSRMNSEDHLGIDVYFSQKDSEIADAWNADLKGNTWYSQEAARIAKQQGLPAEKIGKRGLPYDPSVAFLQGLYSANGSVIKAGRVALKTIDRAQASELVRVLRDHDINAYITTNKPKKVKFKNGEYVCKESYDVNISQYDSLLVFARLINFGQMYKRRELKEMLIRRAPKVMSVTEGPVAEVYDFTEPETHWGVVEGVVVHNSEIILRPYQFCNLSEVVVREEDTLEDLKRKARVATILGTIQSTLTDFRYLRNIWKRNTEEERLLGVSLTGIMDHPVLCGSGTRFEDYDNMLLEDILEDLKDVTVSTNESLAGAMGIPQSTAITCVKPSGTVSQLVDSASGIHPRFSKYYIRRVRADIKDPLARLMQDQGFPCEVDHTNPSVMVFSFPQKAPEEAVTVDQVGAMSQLELWKIYQDYWCEHKPSITVYYKDEEFLEVGAWLYKNFDSVSGISFLPYSDHTYAQAPYEEIDEETYNKLVEELPELNWESLGEYEQEDNTTASQELACVGTSCEVQ